MAILPHEAREVSCDTVVAVACDLAPGLACQRYGINYLHAVGGRGCVPVGVVCRGDLQRYAACFGEGAVLEEVKEVVILPGCCCRSLCVGKAHGSGCRRGRGNDRRLAGGPQQLRTRYGQGPGILAGERRVDGCLHGDFGDGTFECQGHGCRGAVSNGFAHSGSHYEAPAALGFGRNFGERAVVVGGGGLQFGEQRGFRGNARQRQISDGIKVAGRTGRGMRQGERCGAGREFGCCEIAQHDQVAFGVEHVHGERGQGFLPRFGGRGFGKERTGRGFVGERHGYGCSVGIGLGVRCSGCGFVFVAGIQSECGQRRDKHFFHC